MKNTKTFALLFLAFISVFSSAFATTTGEAQWAQSTTNATSYSSFSGVTLDKYKNIYAVGHLDGSGPFDFGNGATVGGGFAFNKNTLIVKYGTNGNAEWAKSIASATNYSEFYGATTDSSGNVYAVGYITGSSPHNFGNGVVVSGYSSNKNPVLVKYDATGNTQWARTAFKSFFYDFKSVVVDNDGYIYVVSSELAATYGDNQYGVSMRSPSGISAVLVKYDSDGHALAARTLDDAQNSSDFYSITLDNNGYLYVVGQTTGYDIFDFGNGVTTTGPYSGYNPVLVKYESSRLEAQWAKTLTWAPNYAYYDGVAVDSDGNIYVSGAIKGTDTFNFGNGVTAAGSSSSNNGLIVKFNNYGVAEWAKTTVSGATDSRFNSISLAASGSSYVSGVTYSSGALDFGNGVTVTPASNKWNFITVKYDVDGVAQWAKTVDTGLYDNELKSVVSGSDKDIYAVGYIKGNSNYNIDDGVTVKGAFSDDGSKSNVLLIKYIDQSLDSSSYPVDSSMSSSPSVPTPSAETIWAKSMVNGTDFSELYNVALHNGTIYASGQLYTTGDFNLGNGVEVSSGDTASFISKYDSNGNPQLAKRLPCDSENLNSLIEDSLGNIYVLAKINEVKTYDFGNGVFISGSYYHNNPVLIKYDSNLNAQWAKKLASCPSTSYFKYFAIDSGGNIHVVCDTYSAGTYDFGNGVSISVPDSTSVLVKYDSSGNALTTKVLATRHESIAFDSSDNMYMLSYINGTDTVDFGNGITATGVTAGTDAVLVKYNSSGDAEWAKTIVSGDNNSKFYDLVVDSNSNVYISGMITGTGIFDFGNGVTVSGPYSGDNGLLIKYNSSGTPQWAKSLVSSMSYSIVNSIALDNNEEPVVAGKTGSRSAIDFGNGITVRGLYIPPDGYPNLIVAKYSSDGEAQWAKSLKSGSSYSYFYSVVVSAANELYVVGLIDGAGTYGLGDGITVKGSSDDSNILMVKYLQSYPSSSSSVPSSSTPAVSSSSVLPVYSSSVASNSSSSTIPQSSGTASSSVTSSSTPAASSSSVLPAYSSSETSSGGIASSSATGTSSSKGSEATPSSSSNSSNSKSNIPSIRDSQSWWKEKNNLVFVGVSGAAIIIGATSCCAIGSYVCGSCIVKDIGLGAISVLVHTLKPLSKVVAEAQMPPKYVEMGEEVWDALPVPMFD